MQQILREDSPVQETAQKRFERLYITSSQICKRFGVTRVSVMQAYKRGLLPEPVRLGTALCVWELPAAQPYLDAWGVILSARRNNAQKVAA